MSIYWYDLKWERMGLKDVLLIHATFDLHHDREAGGPLN